MLCSYLAPAGVYLACCPSLCLNFFSIFLLTSRVFSVLGSPLTHAYEKWGYSLGRQVGMDVLGWEATDGSRASTTHLNLEAQSLPDDFRLVLPLPQDLTIEAAEVKGKLWTKATHLQVLTSTPHSPGVIQCDSREDECFAGSEGFLPCSPSMEG